VTVIYIVQFLLHFYKKYMIDIFKSDIEIN